MTTPSSHRGSENSTTLWRLQDHEELPELASGASSSTTMNSPNPGSPNSSVANPWVVVTERREAPHSAALQSAVDALMSNNRTNGALIPAAGSDNAGFWSLLPERFAMLTMPPTSAGWLVVRRDRLPNRTDGQTPMMTLWKWSSDSLDEGRLTVVRDASLPPTLGPSQFDAETVGPLPQLVHSSSPRLAEWLETRILRETTASSSGQKSAEWMAVRAGLWLWHGCWEASHETSQQIEGAGRHRNGDYWHAIAHRMEPDPGNARYWFRSVGVSPVYRAMTAIAENCLTSCDGPEASDWLSKLVRSGRWDSSAFIDLCVQAQTQPDSGPDRAARRIQKWEMLRLLEQSVKDAGGD